MENHFCPKCNWQLSGGRCTTRGCELNAERLKAESRCGGKKDAQITPKPDMADLIGDFMLLMGDVLKHGKDKYGSKNWMEPPLGQEDYKDARLRHAFKEGKDKDSGLDHLAHEAVNCMMEWWHKREETRIEVMAPCQEVMKCKPFEKTYNNKDHMRCTTWTWFPDRQEYECQDCGKTIKEITHDD